MTTQPDAAVRVEDMTPEERLALPAWAPLRRLWARLAREQQAKADSPPSSDA